MTPDLDARDRLTSVLLLARAKTGIYVPEGRFIPGHLASSIRDVRDDLRALDGALAVVEEKARNETSSKKA